MDAENSNKLTNKYSKKKVLEMFVIILVTAVIWNLPLNSFGIDGLTIVQQRVIAIFVFATLSWLTEAIPSWATSLVIITSMCLTVSNNSISCFKETGAKLSANGSELAMTKDITFTSGVYKGDKVVFDLNEKTLVLNGKDITMKLPEMKKGETLLVTYKTTEGDKGYISGSKNITIKGGQTTEGEKTMLATVNKDGRVALTSKGGAVHLKSIELLDKAADNKSEAVKKWDFTTPGNEDLKKLAADRAAWVAKGNTYSNKDVIEGADFGAELNSTDIMATFANPVIMLFLGGFVLAIAATKSGLDVLLARNLIRPFGNKSETVLLGFLLITGVFSMFVSNTATAAMMLTFLTPVFAALPANGKGRIALTLSIPVAANIGGMATPIGTPPNAIAVQALHDTLHLNISFGQWMMFMFPLVIALLLISWVVILRFFPFTKKTIELEITGNVHKGWRMWVVAITFIVTILMWLLDRVTGVDANTVAMIPMGVFALTGVITARDLQSIDWSVIWMVAGGFALGLGLNGSGLAAAAIDSIPFGSWSPIVIMVVSGVICYLLSNFISNTATAALLVPILAVVCTGMGDRLDAIGGTSTVIIGIALAASSAMCLPISTPPNAVAYSTGLVNQKDMLKIGLMMGILSMVIGYGVLYLVGITHLLG